MPAKLTSFLCCSMKKSLYTVYFSHTFDIGFT